MVMRWVIRIMVRSRSWGRQIALRQHLALLDRRLVEWIDAKEARRDDGLQHEVHEQFAEAPLVEPLEADGAHRTAVAGQGLGGGAALRGHQGSPRLARAVRPAGEGR